MTWANIKNAYPIKLLNLKTGQECSIPLEIRIGYTL